MMDKPLSNHQQAARAHWTRWREQKQAGSAPRWAPPAGRNEGTQAMNAPPLPYTLLGKAKDITGWSDAQLAQVVGLGRSTVQAYVSGRLPEYLDGQQTRALLDALRLYRDQVSQSVMEAELFA